MHAVLWEAMEKMLLGIILGAREVRTVGCVEGLLILAEWVPHADASLSNISHKGNGGLAGTEDTAAWTLVGLAVRQAYLLHLDKYAFRGDASEVENANLHRKRLAWTFTYIADRQISIRMGQAFWCRGPSLATKFTASDFPTLQPQNAYEDDYASVLQSQLELTVLFGNIHDLLYASKPRTISLMLQGDYTKYLDDSVQGLAAWKQNWNQLDVGAHLKLLLELKYEYLRLYVHGFAFQAAMSRTPSTPPNHSGVKLTSRFPHGVLATPDGRHIMLGISAAKSVLTMLGHRISPTRHLRYLGPRFYLYAIHCAVFLYKAASYGAIGTEGRNDCVNIIQRYIDNLGVAASCERHIAARHSALLTSLWIRKEARDPPPNGEAVTTTTENTQPFTPDPPMPSMSDQATNSLTTPEPNNTQSYLPNFTGIMAPPPRYSIVPPESFVTGLYGTNQQFNEFDIYNFMDLGAYGEPDLRNLIQSVPFDE
ncbi:uncharacterized protein N0V89_007951 [Didymosphaeria variabile]|uniref:Xylanolytic transcriptional activator regulatory domain-containing protein n=1 Tax=Didymosphaeria variabile TaxID=1932322 RepID=A0A9W8XGP9_9PLEO|nr:uncharacterized protein N0V89_007951 [Didymosphaeria variabile]KAJ4349337.1 hypothetical protein N0V89_007951 [Didymosphaeria variabile]